MGITDFYRRGGPQRELLRSASGFIDLRIHQSRAFRPLDAFPPNHPHLQFSHVGGRILRRVPATGPGRLRPRGMLTASPAPSTPNGMALCRADDRVCHPVHPAHQNDNVAFSR